MGAKLAALALLAAAALPARAAGAHARQWLSIGPGLGARMSPAEDLRYLFVPARRLGAGLDLGHAARTDSDKTLTALGLLRWSPLGPGLPFLLAGAGGRRTTEIIDTTSRVESPCADAPIFERRRALEDRWDLATTLRVGLDFALSPANPEVLTIEAGIDGVSGPPSVLMIAVRYGWRL